MAALTKRFLRTLGNVLREKRKEAELSQEDIERETGLSRVAISNWENGEKEATLSSLYTLSEGLNCSIPKVLTEVEFRMKSAKKTK